MTARGDDRYFRELAEHSDAALWMFSADLSELLFVNSAYERIFGRPVDQLYDRPLDFMQAVHPADRDRVRSAVERVSRGEPVELEFRVNEAEDYGRLVWVEGAPIFDEEGDFVRISGVARDVTDRRSRHEVQLERYATIVEATGDPVYTLDADGRFTFVNQALAALAGVGPEELVGEHASRVLADEDVERGEELIASLLEGEADRGTYEMDLRTADGRTVPCENHVALLPMTDEFRGTVGVLRDISDRREREAELRRQVERFEAIVETIPEPIVHVVFEDGEPIVERVNPAFTEVFGLGTDEVRGRSINEAIVPAGRMDEAEEIDEHAQVGDTVEREVRRLAADGLREFRFRVNWFEAVGDVREAIGVYVDITDQKRRQRELERQNERLDEFAGVVSHDLRNPLNVIQGRTELARETGEATHFDAIERATARMDTLIDDLLSLARAGATVQSMERVSLAEAAEASWRNVDTAAATLDVAADAAVRADESRLQQLFENLFRNAVRHGGEDAAVTVGTLDGGFYVADDGPGIPPEEREQVFESGYTTVEGGTGFGLRIVRTIAEAHGWTVEVTESDRRRGAVRGHRRRGRLRPYSPSDVRVGRTRSASVTRRPSTQPTGTASPNHMPT
ncbi:MAG: PAS domain S-box protein [Halobacteriales archaeon]|nr:PAS domain S-box protein [Halobacteriales archaeon]